MDACLQISFKAPRQLLRIILQNILWQQENGAERSRLFQPSNLLLNESPLLKQNDISIKQVDSQSQLIYVSAFPHQVSSWRKHDDLIPSVQWGELVSTYTSNLCQTLSHSRRMSEFLQGLVVQVTPSGFLQFEFQDCAIAQWLNELITNSPTSFTSFSGCSRKQLLTDKRVFAIQHAHARCYSLLHLARQEKLLAWQVKGEGQEFLTNLAGNLRGQKKLWLSGNCHLRTHTPVEKYWINQLMAALDEQVEPSLQSPKQLLNLADKISQAFQRGHQTMQLFGSLATDPRDRLYAHLALLLATQRLLNQLLHALEYDAPFAL